jgi:structural maintenance of chromosome 1
MTLWADNSSLELKEEYEQLKEESERAAETSTFNYHKQRGIKAEIKQYEEQKSEAERYENTVEQRVTSIPRFKLMEGSSGGDVYSVEIIPA